MENINLELIDTGMTKEDYKQIWKEIFARHKVLIRLEAEGHKKSYRCDVVGQFHCNCIVTILQQHDYDVDYWLARGRSQWTLCSRDKKAIMRFNKIGSVPEIAMDSTFNRDNVDANSTAPTKFGDNKMNYMVRREENTVSQEEIDETWREIWAVHRVLVRMHGEGHCKNARPDIIANCDCPGMVSRQKLYLDLGEDSGYSISKVVCRCGSNLWQEKLTGFVCAKCRIFVDWYEFREKRKKRELLELYQMIWARRSKGQD